MFPFSNQNKARDIINGVRLTLALRKSYTLKADPFLCTALMTPFCVNFIKTTLPQGPSRPISLIDLGPSNAIM